MNFARVPELADFEQKAWTIAQGFLLNMADLGTLAKNRSKLL